MQNHLKKQFLILFSLLISTSVWGESAPYTAMRAKIQDGLRHVTDVHNTRETPSNLYQTYSIIGKIIHQKKPAIVQAYPFIFLINHPCDQ